MNSCLTRRDFLCKWSASLLAARMGMGRPAGLAAATEFQRGGMVYRRLGKTGMDVSLLSFGSHTDPTDRIPAPHPRKNVLSEQGQARRDRIISRALDMGVNLLDVYEEEGQWAPAARLIKGRRDKVFVSLAVENRSLDPEIAFKLFGYVDLYRMHTTGVSGQTLQDWDKFRKAKEAGKIRAIGITTHDERTLLEVLTELEGLDFLFFPYNFIQARADYSQFLPEAQRRGVALIAMKPLASGSIMRLDPQARPGAKPEFDFLAWKAHDKPILAAAIAELTKMLGRMPDETLCMAAMRFVYSRHFVSTVITGMFEERLLEDNYQALVNYQQMHGEEQAALEAARQVARLLDTTWLPAHYRWLEERWGA
jgi:aryl-alcohol dehydrogenase-like predicted oxidoreductase